MSLRGIRGLWGKKNSWSIVLERNKNVRSLCASAGNSTPASTPNPTSSTSIADSVKTVRAAHPFLKEVTPETRRRNLATAVVLFSFVGFVYYTAISKMKGGSSGKDELDEVIEQEMLVKKKE